MSYMTIWGRIIPERGNSKLKGPEVTPRVKTKNCFIKKRMGLKNFDMITTLSP